MEDRDISDRLVTLDPTLSGKCRVRVEVEQCGTKRHFRSRWAVVDEIEVADTDGAPLGVPFDRMTRDAYAEGGLDYERK